MSKLRIKQMTSEEINKLLEGVNKPIYKIEADLKMPKTTLQKALKGERELSVRWEIALKEQYWRPTEDEILRLPINYHREDKDYFTIIRQLLDRKSLLVLRYEIENSKVLSDAQKKGQLSTLSFKLQRAKY